MKQWPFRRSAGERIVGSSGRPLANPSTRPSTFFSRLVNDRSGTAAIEFAIVALPLFGFVLLIFQISIYHYSLQSLNYATRLAARQVMTGSAQVDAATETSFKNKLLCPKILFGISCDLVSVNAYKVADTSDEVTATGIYRFIDTATKTLRSTPAHESFCLGGPSDYVLLDVTYKFPNFVGSLLSVDKKGTTDFLLRSTSFFRNEPFEAKGTAC